MKYKKMCVSLQPRNFEMSFQIAPLKKMMNQNNEQKNLNYVFLMRRILAIERGQWFIFIILFIYIYIEMDCVWSIENFFIIWNTFFFLLQETFLIQSKAKSDNGHHLLPESYL